MSSAWAIACVLGGDGVDAEGLEVVGELERGAVRQPQRPTERQLRDLRPVLRREELSPDRGDLGFGAGDVDRHTDSAVHEAVGDVEQLLRQPQVLLARVHLGAGAQDRQVRPRRGAGGGVRGRALSFARGLGARASAPPPPHRGQVEQRDRRACAHVGRLHRADDLSVRIEEGWHARDGEVQPEGGRVEGSASLDGVGVHAGEQIREALAHAGFGALGPGARLEHRGASVGGQPGRVAQG